MGKKIQTLDEIRERVLKFNSNIEVLEELYKEVGKSKKGILRFFKCKCKIDNYVWEISYSNLINAKQGCPKCKGKVKLTLDELRVESNRFHPNIEILGEFYKNVGKTKKKEVRYINCICSIDKHKWSKNAHKLSQGCPKCAGHGKTNLIEIKDKLKLINPTIEIISEVYFNNSTKLDCKCMVENCNYEWSVDAQNLLKGSGCPKCGGSLRLTLEQIKKRVYEINPNIEILSTNYCNSHSYLECHCLVDGCDNYWSAKSTNLINNKNGCKKCRIRNTQKEKAYNWKGGVSPLHNYIRGKILKWKYDSFNKYDSKCDITGICSKKNIIHHVSKNFSDILIETLDILNLKVYDEVKKYSEEELISIENLCSDLHYKYGLGICLCEEEHNLFHSIYGRKNNTLKQYKEFKESRLNNKHLD